MVKTINLLNLFTFIGITYGQFQKKCDISLSSSDVNKRLDNKAFCRIETLTCGEIGFDNDARNQCFVYYGIEMYAVLKKTFPEYKGKKIDDENKWGQILLEFQNAMKPYMEKGIENINPSRLKEIQNGNVVMGKLYNNASSCKDKPIEEIRKYIRIIKLNYKQKNKYDNVLVSLKNKGFVCDESEKEYETCTDRCLKEKWTYLDFYNALTGYKAPQELDCCVACGPAENCNVISGGYN